MINSNNKLDVTLDFENVDMNDVNVYVAFKNNGKLVGMKMPQASELKGIDLIDKQLWIVQKLEESMEFQ